MFVEELKDAGNAERGIKNFQHPQRSNQWDATLDRFSFILIDLSLSLLEKYPDLWDETGSDIDAFLFRANDIYNPDASQLFQDLKTFSDEFYGSLNHKNYLLLSYLLLMVEQMDL